MATGEALVVLAHQERAARYRLHHVTTRATANGAGYMLSGAKSVVPAGDEADAFIVPALSQGGLALYLVERSAAGVSTRPYSLQDGSRAAELSLHKPWAQA